MDSDSLVLDSVLPADYRSHLFALENRLAPRKKRTKGAAEDVIAVGRAATVYRVAELPDVVVKRLPDFEAAERRDFYARSVDAYAKLLTTPIGLDVLAHQCEAVDGPAGAVLYIVQERAEPDTIADQLFTVGNEELRSAILRTVLRDTLRVWHRNAIEREIHTHDSQIGLDARLSNWSISVEDGGVRASYFDTGTPFIRRLGRDRIDPDIFPHHIPARPGTFLSRRKPEEELDRFYDFRLALVDLLAEIGAINTAHLDPSLEIVNTFLRTDAEDQNESPITSDEVKPAIKIEKKRREKTA
jgi:hypothetical protein